MEAPTHEEIAKVRAWRCNQTGSHSFDFVMAGGSLDPLQAICSDCGAAYTMKRAGD